MYLQRTRVEEEIWMRIRLTMAAYAYEFDATSIMTDEEYDAMSLRIDLSIDTGRPYLDEFWRREFRTYTGQWIHKHPELDRVKWRYESLKAGGTYRGC